MGQPWLRWRSASMLLRSLVSLGYLHYDPCARTYQPTSRVGLLGSWVEPALLRGGLIPSWAKDAKIGNRLINARAETAGEKPAFRDPMRDRRCLILVDGFYEWAPGKPKLPYLVRMRGGRGEQRADGKCCCLLLHEIPSSAVCVFRYSELRS